MLCLKCGTIRGWDLDFQ